MHVDGLTPSTEQLARARQAFHNRPGLLAMIRPRQGEFSYAREEIRTMHRQIVKAADAGADGIVFGAAAEAAMSLVHAVELWQIRSSESPARSPLTCSPPSALYL